MIPGEHPKDAPPSVQDQRKKIPVAVVACEDYLRETVCRALVRAVTLAGGLGTFIPPNTRVLVKPNLLQGLPPEHAVCTHPEVVRAVVHLLSGQGCTVTLADSPGGGIRYHPKALERQYGDAGYTGIATDPGCLLNLDTGVTSLKFPAGKVCREFPLIAPLMTADHVVVVSKVKTHVLTLLSGATKNLFGLIPGLEKPLYHSRFQTGDLFGDMLIDLNLLVQPSLQVADAIVIMEGDGPTSGSPRRMGALLVSPSPLALDMVLCRLLCLDPLDVPYLRCAIARGLISHDSSDIEIVGDPLSAFTLHDLKKPRTYHGNRMGIRTTRLFRIIHHVGRVYGMRPSVEGTRCTGCGKCATICPSQAITLDGGQASIDQRACIRCYCCHEMCTEDAISLRRNLIGSLLHGMIRRSW